MNLLDDLKNRAKKSNSSWEQIDGLIGILDKQALSDNEKILLKIIVLLSEQIRPIGSAVDLNKLSDDVNNMLNDFISQVKR